MLLTILLQKVYTYIDKAVKNIDKGRYVAV